MFAPGKLLANDYRVERLIGRGGQASVFEVSHTRIRRRLAAKIIHASLDVNPDFIVRFNREADILAALDHPHTVKIYDKNITDDGYPYLIMELLDGEDLAAHLRRCGPLPEHVAMRILHQVGDAIQAAHDRGILHRDLKPSNLFLVNSGHPPMVKVLDFGIAKLLCEGSTHPTDSSVIIGTAAYMSPEQAHGKRGADQRSDQFSLASILHEMISGQAAFYRAGELPLVTLHRIAYERPAPLPAGTIRPHVQKALDRALSKLPNERFPSIKEFIAAVMTEPPAETPPSWRSPEPLLGQMAQMAEDQTVPTVEKGPVRYSDPDSLRAADSQIGSFLTKKSHRYGLGTASLMLGILGFAYSQTGTPVRPWTPKQTAAAPGFPLPRPASASSALQPGATTSLPAGTPVSSGAPERPSPLEVSVPPLGAASPQPADQARTLGLAPAGALKPKHGKIRVYPDLEGADPYQRSILLPCFQKLIKINPLGKLLNKRLILQGRARLKVQPAGELPFPVEQLSVLDECIQEAAAGGKLPEYVRVVFRGEELVP